MRGAGIAYYKWRFDRVPASFEAIFMTNSTPYELLIGAIATNFAITLKIEPGYNWNAANFLPQITAHYAMSLN